MMHQDSWNHSQGIRNFKNENLSSCVLKYVALNINNLKENFELI